MATEKRKSTRAVKNGEKPAAAEQNEGALAAGGNSEGHPRYDAALGIPDDPHSDDLHSSDLPSGDLPSDTVRAMIQNRAYEIWQEENFPSGKDQEHWLRAERETLENTRLLRAALSRR